MPLDLKDTLEIALSDTTNEIWSTTELDTILSYALAMTNQVRQRAVRDTISLVDDQDSYTLTNVVSVNRVDLIDEDNKLVRVMPQGAWEIWGDNSSTGQTLYINPIYARTPYKLRVHGYGPYDYTTNTPDTTVQMVILALARAEALRRLVTDKARFRQWAQTNPRGDTSTNELIQSVNEADAEAQRLLRSIKLIKRPTVGRI
jgi:hypothetical protein